jgi:hypothetical protein
MIFVWVESDIAGNGGLRDQHLAKRASIEATGIAFFSSQPLPNPAAV